jgi:hypothetical protein
MPIMSLDRIIAIRPSWSLCDDSSSAPKRFAHCEDVRTVRARRRANCMNDARLDALCGVMRTAVPWSRVGDLTQSNFHEITSVAARV